jgi:hypothetical protein
MSKDPAVLFYTSDFISGTLTMTDEQRGKYIILLCLQHQQGLLSHEDMLNICKTYDAKIFSKFIKTPDGLYYNDRMKIESTRRKKYSESRSKNRINISSSYDNHMKDICKSYDNHMETETETITITEDVTENIKKKKQKQKKISIPTVEEVRSFFEENGYDPDKGQSAWMYYNDANWFDSHGNQVRCWKQKMRSVWFKEENKKPIQKLA